MKSITVLFSACALFLCHLPAGAAEPGRDRPNILLIFADDPGYGDIGCYDLVAEGVSLGSETFAGRASDRGGPDAVPAFLSSISNPAAIPDALF